MARQLIVDVAAWKSQVRGDTRALYSTTQGRWLFTVAFNNRPTKNYEFRGTYAECRDAVIEFGMASKPKARAISIATRTDLPTVRMCEFPELTERQKRLYGEI